MLNYIIFYSITESVERELSLNQDLSSCEKVKRYAWNLVSPSSFHAFAKEYKGTLLNISSLTGGMRKFSLLRNVVLMFLLVFFVHELLKEVCAEL